MKTKSSAIIAAVILVAAGVVCFFNLRREGPAVTGIVAPGFDETAASDQREFPQGDRVDLAPSISQIQPVAAPADATLPGSQDAAFRSLPSAEQQSLWQAFSTARHAIEALTEQEKTLPQNEGVEYFAHNPGQRLTARFLTSGGVRLGSGLPGRDWQATLKLDTGSPALAVTATANRVEMRHEGGLTEWFENKPEGLEHGFTVAHPQGTMGMLEIPLALDGLRVEADPEVPGSLRFIGNDGIPVLGYGGLKAWDAAGTALAAEMRVNEDGHGVLLAIDDRAARYPVVIDPLIGSLEQKLTGGEEAEYFGHSVALDGDTALIGCEGFPHRAWVFTRTGTVWTQQAMLAVVDGEFQFFGRSVALAGDTALVGAPGMDRGLESDVGSAYVFTRAGTVWTRQAKLTADDGGEGDYFGASVALAGDTAVVGAPATLASFAGPGSAYVFTRSGTVWNQQGKLTPDDGFDADDFGFSVALAGDTALIGAPASLDLITMARGSAYVFTRADAVWTQQAKFMADPGVPHQDFFGFSVVLSGDSALIGAPYDDTAPDNQAGSSYVFTRTGTDWIREVKLTSEDGNPGNNFGWSVALAGDTALIGEVGDDTVADLDAGSAHVFARTEDDWSRQAKLTAPDGAEGEAFGCSVALSGDTVLVGADHDDWDPDVPYNAVGVGSAYVFRLVPVPTFAEWATAAGLTGEDALPSAIPFGDGVENLLKYAFKLNGNAPDVRVLVPGTGTAGLPSITLDRSGPVLRFEYLRRKGSGLAYTPQKSTDLTNWQPLAATPLPPIDIDAAWERVVIAEPCDLATTPKLFGRVEVVLPP